MENPKTLAPAQIEMLGQGRYSDLAVPGLCLKVDDKGRRTWWYRRRIARAKTIITKQLGAFPAFSIAAARQWAVELNEATQRGENPLAIQRAEAARAAMTLDKAHQAYIAAIRRGDRKKLRPRTIGDKQGIYDRLADGLPRKVAQDFDTKQNGQTPSARLLTNVAHRLEGTHPSRPSSTVERRADGRQFERHEEALNNREGTR